MSPRRIRESSPNLFNADPLPDFASTQGEIRRAVQRNAIQRGQFFAINLARLGFDQILNQIDLLAQNSDGEAWRENAEHLGIDVTALDILDNIPVRYPYYFCDPAYLIQSSSLVAYYRNVAMVSAKVMRSIGLDTAPHEAGQPIMQERAEQIANYFNSTVSALIAANPSLVTERRHLEMVFANLGESIGGSWRNEVGRLSYVEVIGGLVRHLHKKGCLAAIAYDLKGSLVIDDEEELVSRDNRLGDSDEFPAQLEEVENKRVVYKTVFLRNGNELRLNRQITWNDSQGKEYKIGPDLSAFAGNESLTWGGELKGGADPAGSDEHWKTAKSAFDRIIEASDKTDRPAPKLSFIATILVDRVAREAAIWIGQGKLTSVYNLTQITERLEKREAFFQEIAGFLGCEAE
ncbi:MAG: hypothetical protein FJ030_08000 [Chloroflexi bacterium]|nr:hypothetical protein [Chloroflexota bacterium]